MVRILLIAVTAALLFLAGSAIYGELSGRYRPWEGEVELKCLYGLNLRPGTWIGYSEHFPDFARYYGVASTIILGHREIRLPVRFTTTLTVTAALSLLAALALALYRRIYRRRHGAEQDHCTERGRATSVANPDAPGRSRR